MNEIIQLLNKKAKTTDLKSIAEEAGLGYTWLHMLHSGKIPDPSINLMNTLYDYLVKK